MILLFPPRLRGYSCSPCSPDIVCLRCCGHGAIGEHSVSETLTGRQNVTRKRVPLMVADMDAPTPNLAGRLEALEAEQQALVRDTKNFEAFAQEQRRLMSEWAKADRSRIDDDSERAEQAARQARGTAVAHIDKWRSRQLSITATRLNEAIALGRAEYLQRIEAAHTALKDVFHSCQSALAAILENRRRKVARPNAKIAMSWRLNRDFHLSAPERDDRPIDLGGGLSVSNGFKLIDIAPPVSREGTMARPVPVEGTSLPTPGPVDSFDMKAVFLAPRLKNELFPARLIPSKTTHYQSGDEHGDQLSLHRPAHCTSYFRLYTDVSDLTISGRVGQWRGAGFE